MDSEEKAELQEIADATGLSMSEVIRDAIKLYGVIKAIHLGQLEDE